MQADSSASESRTSRFRGLSYDKKWNGWRVRLYWRKKQRHVGRYTDEITAAKAYDKAAMYLYGMDAVTNFGLQACLADQTEVSPHILRATQEGCLQEQRQLQQRMRQQSCSPIQPVALNRTEGCTVQRYHPLLQQEHSTGRQQLCNPPAKTMLAYAPAPVATLVPSNTNGSTSSCSAMTMQQQQVGVSAVQMNMSVMLCSSQHAASASLTISGAACAPVQQQSCLPMPLPSLAQPMQLSVEPQLVIIAKHVSTATGVPPAPAGYGQAGQLLHMLSLPSSSNSASSTSAAPWAAAAAAAPVAPVAMPAAAQVVSVGHPLLAYASTCSNMASGSSPAGVSTPPLTQLPFAVQPSGSLLQPSSTLLQPPPATLAAPDAGAMMPAAQFEQQLQLQETMSVCSNSSSCSPMAAATAAQLLDPVTRALFFGCC